MHELLREEDGQDLVEYALLTLFVVLASIALWNTVATAVGTAYRGYDSNIQDLWSPCDPGDTAC